jgi:carbon starvation protein
MLDKESHARFIGYGAMLMEGVVGIVALVAASSLSQGDYFAINAPPDKFAALGLSMDHLPELSEQIGERLQGRAGGAVSLAVGMSQIFAGLPGLRHLISYWYHFAIMFEALFILTTVDTGTRVARFLVQEMVGRAHPRLEKFGKSDWLPGALISTALVCFGWVALVWSGSISTIWPLLGISNQLLACIALCAATTMIINSGRAKYAWVTLMPLAFVGVATETAGFQLITQTFIPKLIRGGKPVQGYVLTILCALAMAALVAIFLDALARWIRPREKQMSQPDLLAR